MGAWVLAEGLVGPPLSFAQGNPASRTPPVPAAEPRADERAQNPLEAIRGLFERLFRSQREEQRPAEPAFPPPVDSPRPAAGEPAPAPGASSAPAPTAPSAPATQPAAPSASTSPASTLPPAAAGSAPSAATPPPTVKPAASAVSAAASVTASADALTRPIVLLLPAKAPGFARAAEVTRKGFMAARTVARTAAELVVIETDGSAESVRAAYREALGKNPGVVVGPMTKIEAGALLDEPIKVPTLALNLPDGNVRLPKDFHVLSLNTEFEARVAAEAVFRPEAAVAVIVTTNSPLAKRGAIAFVDAWGKRGGTVKEVIEFAGSIGKVRQSVERSQAQVVFLAADAERARLLRPYLGRNTTVIATSQIFAGAVKSEAQKQHDMNGVRFIDMPWLHQPDHPASMIYPRHEGALSPDLDRLYALGIDAFRVAQELAGRRSAFEIDGVTGKLAARDGLIVRLPIQAQFRDGVAAQVKE
jgi:uncharacterized protein